MPFLTEPPPARGVALPVAPGISRIVAPNPGAMTYHGTNTYLIDTDAGIAVLDPGPDDPAHVAAILAATSGRVARVLVSHTHLDHVGALPALVAATGAPVAGFAPTGLPGLTLDHPLADGDTIDGLRALHTPGHATDHVCFLRDDGVVFSADHVMSWSTSVVSEAGGGMAAYFASLRRLLARDGDRLFLPGHGPPLENPKALVQELLDHRLQREAAIAAALGPEPATPAALVLSVYGPIAEALRAPAARNVVAHLHKLVQDGRAVQVGESWRAA